MISVVFSFLMIAYYWNELPDVVPTHFNVLGQPDSYGSKWFLLIIPVIALLIFIGITYLNKFPHIFNYPVEVSERNAIALYKISKRMNALIMMITCEFFFYITFSQITSARFHGLGMSMFVYFFILFIICIMFTLIYAIVKMSKARP